MMTPQEYRSRLSSIITRVESILESVGKGPEIKLIKENLSVVGQDSSEDDVFSFLAETKASLLRLLNLALEDTQIAFVEMEEPDNSDLDLFKDYLNELKEYKQSLLSPSSEIREKISALLKRSKTILLNELQRQAILFPTECLDTILACPEVNQEDGANWVVMQINEVLNTLIEEINVRIGASIDAINEILDSAVVSVNTDYQNAINLSRQNSSSATDNVFGLVRQSLPSIGIGTLSFGLVSSLMNPIIGAVTGLAAGGMFLWKSQQTSVKQKKIMELKQQLVPKVTLAINELKIYVVEKYEKIEEELDTNIELMLESVKSEMNDCVDVLKGFEINNKEYDSEQILLNKRMIALESYIKQLEILNTNPLTQNNK